MATKDAKELSLIAEEVFPHRQEMLADGFSRARSITFFKGGINGAVVALKKFAPRKQSGSSS